MKTSELTGAALDWAVAKCEGVEFQSFLWAENQRALDGEVHYFNYSINWLSGGPIVERERIDIEHDPANKEWSACWFGSDEYCAATGPTPLVAAMRCYVQACFGDEVEIPEEALR